MGLRYDEADLCLLEADGVDDRTQELIYEIRNLQDERDAAVNRLAECKDEAEDIRIALRALRNYLEDAPMKADELADDIEVAALRISAERWS